ncbi:hypothetical protein Cs7R123_68650 [Catellatospora sp. TT07R-123]|uniref:immunoglobulin domain-containing protein n=1 Tax=Catellatospora sp. TT07R-123 TaxID=2733863 RepID=UPI001B08D63D|nr:immunoglobulin domain-containing protein [Catellatospora sp. TT07R-123]GHJ49523.1 hypothetical protein Cs7R123_68650 [Catellatospora sp. TT07R-123]
MRISSAAVRAGLTVAVVGAALAVPTAAHATSTVSCESGYSTIECGVSGGPVDSVQWTRNGTYIPSWDNQMTITTACTSGQWYTFQATVTVGGVVETPVRSILCWRGAWR